VDELGRGRAQAIEVFGIETVDEVELSAFEAEQFDVAIGLNVEVDGIEVGQAASWESFFQK